MALRVARVDRRVVTRLAARLAARRVREARMEPAELVECRARAVRRARAVQAAAHPTRSALVSFPEAPVRAPAEAATPTPSGWMTPSRVME